jgi:hypothetical protein
MTRWLVVFTCAFAFVAAAPLGFEAQAKKRGHRMCAAAGMDGKQSKWRCKAGQKCCYDWLAGKGNCVGANEVCF